MTTPIDMADIYPDQNLTVEYLSRITEDAAEVEERDDVEDYASVGSKESIISGTSLSLSNDQQNTHDMDIPLFSMADMAKMINYSHQLLKEKQGKVPLVKVKQEHQVPLVTEKTNKLEKSPPQIMQKATAAEGKFKLVPKKDYNRISPEMAQALKDLHFSTSTSGRNNNEKLEKLHNYLDDIGILTLVKLQRKMPKITSVSPLGYTEANIIFRPESTFEDLSTNQFVDIDGTFDPLTWTQLIAIPEDDVLSYKAGIMCLKKVINLAFDPQLLLYVLPFMTAGKVLEAI